MKLSSGTWPLHQSFRVFIPDVRYPHSSLAWRGPDSNWHAEGYEPSGVTVSLPRTEDLAYQGRDSNPRVSRL